MEILGNVRTAQICSDTTPGHVSTQLHLRDFLKLGGVSVYLQCYRTFLPHFFLAFPCVYGKFWTPNNFLQGVSHLLYKLYLFWTLHLLLSVTIVFILEEKNELLFPYLFSRHQTWFYKPLSGLSSVYLCSRLKNARYIVIIHTKTVLLFWSSFLSCSSSCPLLLYLLLRWTV